MVKLVTLFFASIGAYSMPQFAGSSSASDLSPLKQIIRLKLHDQASGARSDLRTMFMDDKSAGYSAHTNVRQNIGWTDENYS